MVTTHPALPASGDGSSQAKPPISVPEFARATDLSERAVRNALRRGELYGTRLGNRWRIPASELARLVSGERGGAVQ
jgi:excisionase family DNA binding protein